jgi:asparagine synthase (glutamine-hydrolysing)
MNRFAGQLTPDGTLLRAEGSGGRPPETYLGCHVLVCGYIADRRELALALGIGAWQRSSDAELMAHAFRKWRCELQVHVLGEYAVFVFDPQSRSGLLTHDALGLAPLFYTANRDGLAFATQLLDLLDSQMCEVLDHDYLADFLVFGQIVSERTPYRSVKRLLPGMSLELRRGRIHHLRTWDLARILPLQCRDDGEYKERFRFLLTAGVRAALETSGKAWVALSGGLDSSSVACVAAQEGKQPLGAFSLVNPGFPKADEQRWMRAVVDHCGLCWHCIDVGTALPFSRLPDGFLGEPSAAVNDAECRRITNELLASHDVTALLTGNGGDGVLCAWPGPVPSHLADSLFSGHPISTLKAVAAWKAGCTETRSWSYWMLRAVIGPALNHLRGYEIRTAPRLPLSPWIEQHYAKEMGLAERARRRIATPCRHPGRQEAWDKLWTRTLSTASVPLALLNFELRSPLLYRPLVEFMVAIPWEQKLRPRCDRYLQRRALKEVLPELVRRRGHKASGSWSLAEGLRRSKEWIPYLCDTPMMAELGIADAGKWRESVRQATFGQTHGDCFFMAGVAVEAWLKGLASWRSRVSAAAPSGRIGAQV